MREVEPAADPDSVEHPQHDRDEHEEVFEGAPRGPIDRCILRLTTLNKAHSILTGSDETSASHSTPSPVTRPFFSPPTFVYPPPSSVDPPPPIVPPPLVTVAPPAPVADPSAPASDSTYMFVRREKRRLSFMFMY